MAVNQNKHSSSRVQGSRRSTHASTKPASTKPQTSVRKHRTPKKPKKPKKEQLPPSLRFTETRRGKTTERHFSHRRLYRFEEVKGKIVDYVQIFTAGEYHSIDIRFQDKTA
ncbi:MAG TPA: hypothetical protein VE133_04330, partial [Candidatus Sulfotelmatobacter sp.]|nr:hypothetical protein [Candidatus Sulfotelmatobacter sp.]